MGKVRNGALFRAFTPLAKRRKFLPKKRISRVVDIYPFATLGMTNLGRIAFVNLRVAFTMDFSACATLRNDKICQKKIHGFYKIKV